MIIEKRGKAQKKMANKISFQSKADSPRIFSYVFMTSCSCDLDLDPMTLIYEYVLHILKVHLHIKNELKFPFPRSRLSKVRARAGQTHRHIETDKQVRPNALPTCFILFNFATVISMEIARFSPVIMNVFTHTTAFRTPISPSGTS